MSNSVFHFRQFTVRQDKCAMKVGTDGVLIGAWADLAHSCHVLDVGTGTGIIALMIAQRNGQATIDAIDIDKEACHQANENIEKSPFADRIKVIHQSFFNFTTEKKYDLIISNPPFFKNALKCSDAKRRVARHDDSLPLKHLIEHAMTMLSEKGRIALILPVSLSEELDFIVATHRLFFIRRTNVISVEGREAKRFLIEITPHSQNQTNLADSLCLETKDNKRSAQYDALTKDFYL